MEGLDEIRARWRAAGGALLVIGAPGTGKSTLVAALARPGDAVLHADPGQPPFGPPGAVARGRRVPGGFCVDALAGLGTLNAIGHRGALVEAVRWLAGPGPAVDARGGPADAPDGAPGLLVDAPGVFRGPQAEALLRGLADATDARLVLALGRREPPPAAVGLGRPVLFRPADPAARPGTPGRRARRRTAAWDRYLAGARPLALPAALAPDLPDWAGRQVVLLGAGGETLALGEAVRRADDVLLVRCPAVDPDAVRALRVRDARRGHDGLLHGARV
jgi:polynucleotide 5'-kinase involved in rRNA processing